MNWQGPRSPRGRIGGAAASPPGGAGRARRQGRGGEGLEAHVSGEIGPPANAAERLREVFPEHAGIAEKKMFGWLCFLSRGYMFGRRDGIVLGGTFEHGNWSLEPDAQTTANILARHRAIFDPMRG